MADSFDEYDNATRSPSKVKSNTKIDPPRLSDDDSTLGKPPATPEPSDTLEMLSKGKESNFSRNFLLVLVLFVVGFLVVRNCEPKALVASGDEQAYFNNVNTEVGTLKKKLAEKDQTINALKGQLTWVRHLLRIEKENMATAQERIRRLVKELDITARYERFLKVQLKMFYSEPFRKDEARREICFTTNTRNTKCYHLQRPKIQRPIPIRGLR